ncbi:MAG: transcription antitermination factor NusB [Coriobacteriia bacterium]
MGGLDVTVAPARSAALEVVRRVREKQAFASEVLDTVLRARSLREDDAALATRLAYGTVQSAGTLDEALDEHLRSPSSVEPRVRDILRLGAYELLFSRTPPRAIVHESVDAVRAVRPEAAGLANAVLRRLSERADAFPWGDPRTDDGALARATAHPRWLLDLVTRDRGRDAARRMFEADQTTAPLFLWHVPFMGTLADAMSLLEADGAMPVACEPAGCILARRAAFAVRGAAVADGRVLVADVAATVAPLAVRPMPGETIVDLTAGRGTKTVMLQAAAVSEGGPARIIAMDLHPFKVKVLTERMGVLGVPGVEAIVGDATDVIGAQGLPRAGTVDSVLVDAPCTGLGTLRRHPEKRWRASPDDVSRLAEIQSRLLEQAATLVGPGGRVVYSTCSVARAEDEDVVRGFLDGEAGEGFSVESLDEVVPASWRHRVAPEGTFLSMPEADGPDGHFVAALRRMG